MNTRSVALGLAGVLFICTLAPYNDWAVSNTYLVGNYLPVGLLLFFLSFIMLLNGPLWRWAPKRAFSSGELAVSVGMVMVACGVAGSGLTRYLYAAIIGVLYQPGVDAGYLAIIRRLDLPTWMFPTIASDDPAVRANDPVVQNYWTRTPGIDDTFWSHLQAVPWSAWVTPVLTWAIFIFAFWGAILCIAVIVRKQWVENERLPFPIAQIYLSLLEPPQRGRMFNSLFRSRPFWIAAGFVFVLHALGALAQYDPRHFPKIPLTYDITPILNDGIWRFTEPDDAQIIGLRKNTIYFSIIGIAFFLQTKVAFSLWFFYIFFQLMRILYGSWQGTFTYGMQQDQQVGSMIPFALAMLWVGREHWMAVLRQMAGRTREGDPQGRYLPYGVAGWGLAACLLIMFGWLVVAGASIPGALMLVLLIMTAMTVTARVIAETGLLFVQLGFPYWRPWVELMTPPIGIRTTPRSFFFHGWFSMIIGHDVRETLSVFSTHALRVADDTAYEGTSNWRKGAPFIAVLALSLFVAYFVSGASMLYVEYNHGVTLDTLQTTPLNPWATEAGIKSYTLNPTQNYLPPNTGPNEVHSRLGHFGFGFGLVSILSILRLRFAWWPLHPVGFLIAYGWPIKNIWFSLFVGWLIKVLIVRLGGMDLFRGARNFFIGLIIGEAGAAAFWLVVSFVLHMNGMEYKRIMLLPN